MGFDWCIKLNKNFFLIFKFLNVFHLLSRYTSLKLLFALFFSDALRIVRDKKYGAKNADEVGGWDGMVGELVRRVCLGR